jgi:hypothetical protein
VINHIQTSCDMGVVESLTIIYEDNATCVAQMQTGYIKNQRQLQESEKSNILQIKSCDNHTYLFTKLLPLVIFDKCVKIIQNLCK